MNQSHSVNRMMRNRRGSAVVTVLLCLVTASILLLGAMGISLRQRRQVRLEQQMQQTRWLLDAGVQQAIQRIENDPEFKGHTVEVPFDKYKLASVISTVSRKAASVQISVTAKLGTRLDSRAITQRSTTLEIELPEKPKDESTQSPVESNGSRP